MLDHVGLLSTGNEEMVIYPFICTSLGCTPVKNKTPSVFSQMKKNAAKKRIRDPRMLSMVSTILIERMMSSACLHSLD